MSKQKVINRFAFFVHFIILFWIIMFKCNLIKGDLIFGYRSITLIPFANICEVGYFFEYLLNVVVYIPTGIYFYHIFKKKPRYLIVLLICISSFVFETLQYIIAFGGSDISDIISNTLGGIIGMMLYIKLEKKIKMENINVFVLIVGTPIAVFAIIQTIILLPYYMVV